MKLSNGGGSRVNRVIDSDIEIQSLKNKLKTTKLLRQLGDKYYLRMEFDSWTPDRIKKAEEAIKLMNQQKANFNIANALFTDFLCEPIILFMIEN